MQWKLRWAALLFVSSPCAAQAEVGSCNDLLPPHASVEAMLRAITVDDLVRLRDIGPVSPGNVAEPIIALSPNRREIAFQLRRGDPTTNSYCLGMFVAAVAPGALPRAVNLGGELIRSSGRDWSGAEGPSGRAKTITPKWSPNGQWIAFLRRDHGITQAWRARADGSQSEAVTSGDIDVEAVAWSQDGEALIVAVRVAKHPTGPGGDEAAHGYLYDARFAPMSSSKPNLAVEISSSAFVIDLQSHAVREATPDEARLVNDGSRDETTAIMSASGSARQLAWTVRQSPADISSPEALHIRWRDNAKAICSGVMCQRIRSMFWTPNGRSLIFITREGWAQSQLGIYRWAQGQPTARRVLVTDDVLIGCQATDDSLICGHESSLQPRRLVRIDLANGKLTPLFDPNPEFAAIKLGTVQKIRWKNDQGIEVFGDFVLPPEHQPGQKHPLIVVGYESRGFLRGGTGDEYPIQLFATHGYAVLSYERPRDYGLYMGGSTVAEVERLGREGWKDRFSVLSAIETGVNLFIGEGVIDPDRIGLTGFSDGTSTAQFAMINSAMFRAFAISQCCEEQTTSMTVLGPAGADAYRARGFPGLTDINTYFGRISLRANVDRVRAPILMQLSEDEFRFGLESYMALREKMRPVELYVFPDEYHLKWQPAHRLAVYTRNLDWFNFWLRDLTDPIPTKVRQYIRWEDLRAGTNN